MKNCTLLFVLLFLAQLPQMAHAQSSNETPCGTGSALDPSIISNGDFTAGNTGFTSTYTYCSTYNCLFPLSNWGYAVQTNPSYVHNVFVGSDHTTGTGKFLIANGQDSSLVVWSQTVTVDPANSYLFSIWSSSMDTLPHPGSSVIKVLINGTSLGTFTVPTALNTWTKFSAPWYSGTSTTATIVIRDAITDWNGFDYGLDDIALQKCKAGPTAVNEVRHPGRIMVQPNPSDGHFIIGNVPDNANIEVYNMLGSRVFPSSGSQSITNWNLDISHLPAGTYLVRVVDSSSQTLGTEKVMIR